MLILSSIALAQSTKNRIPLQKEIMNETFISIPMTEGIVRMKSDINFVLLDVRRADEYKNGHIPGAVLHTNELMTKENTEALLKDKNQSIYVYCRSGRRSKEASKKLIEYGYKNVIEIGGILDYAGTLEK